MNKILIGVGLIATGIYIFAAYKLFAMSGGINELLTLKLNEVGDFLAGVFGPLTIFWLILGFFQQGIELKQSTEALKMQAKELNNSVQQQKDIVEVSREQLVASNQALQLERQKHIDSYKPNFIFRESGYKRTGERIFFFATAINSGATVKNVSFSINGNGEIEKWEPQSLTDWEKGHTKDFVCEYKNSNNVDEEAILDINYKDGLDNKGVSQHKIIKSKGEGTLTLKIEKI
ncbi:MAG: hypothetical protein GY874_01930 [Desulfobacteraceae bacterium]|nr:hypothetical protein [Desulfobacteraceae bacterium]